MGMFLIVLAFLIALTFLSQASYRKRLIICILLASILLVPLMVTSVDERSRSVSSMRRMNVPPCLRAKSQLKSAVRALPMCRKPVGEGAKRTVTVIPGGWGAAEPISTIGQLVVPKHLTQAGLHQLPCRGMGKLVDDHHVVR